MRSRSNNNCGLVASRLLRGTECQRLSTVRDVAHRHHRAGGRHHPRAQPCPGDGTGPHPVVEADIFDLAVDRLTRRRRLSPLLRVAEQAEQDEQVTRRQASAPQK